MLFLLAIPIGVIVIYGVRRYCQGTYNNLKPIIKEKIILITGGTDGIGKESVKELSSLEGTIIFTGRSEEKAEILIEEIQKENPNAKLDFFKVDFSKFEDVISLSNNIKDKYSYINVLINNAGAMYEKRTFNEYGWDENILVNHLCPFALTGLLLPLLLKNNESRIINVAGKMHFKANFNKNDIFDKEKKHSAINIYSKTKLYNLLFTKGLKKFIENNNYNMKVVALHPGGVDSSLYQGLPKKFKIMRYIMYPFFKLFFKSSEAGAQCTNYLTLCDYKDLENGQYYQELVKRKYKDIVDIEENINEL